VSETVGERLREERKRLGYDQRGFAAKAAVSKNTQLAYEQGKPGMDVGYLLRIAELGADIGYIVTGGREGDEHTAGGAGAAVDPDDLDLVTVDEIDLDFGLGGTFSNLPVVARPQLFPRLWIEAITATSPSLLTFTRGKGDSMQPTINDGDLVLIDRSKVEVREQDAFWALAIGEVVMIKRLRIKGEKVIILSDNERVPPDDAQLDEVHIIGRVIFVGQRK
jgi:transcriptional regulator with XRE-family HTH domain